MLKIRSLFERYRKYQTEISKYLIIAIVFTILSIVISFIWWWTLRMNPLKYQMNHFALNAAQVINRNVGGVVRDAIFVSQYPDVEDAVMNPTAANMMEMKDFLMAFAEANPIYDQIRWIDTEGQERVRINLTGTKAIAVPDSELQNKADRYYVQIPLSRESNNVYYSPMDLNIEHGTIERPY